MTSVRHWDLPGIWVLELRQNFDSFKITWALNALTKPIWLGSLRRQASEQSCVDVFETRRSRAWSFLAMREGILVKSVFMIGSGDPATIISYFLPLVDWYCLRPFNNREIEDLPFWDIVYCRTFQETCVHTHFLLMHTSLDTQQRSASEYLKQGLSDECRASLR